MESMSVFISYSSKDGAMAGELASVLEILRVKTFLAHKDINTGAQWRNVVRKEMCECDILAALLTPHFHDSEYTDQELGAAWGLGKPILPVLVDKTKPTGFITERQGLEYHKKYPAGTACQIFRFALSEIHGEEYVVDNLVGRLVKSKSQMESQHLAFLLLLEQENNLAESHNSVFTTAHAESIKSAMQSNVRVKESEPALMYLDATIKIPELLKTDHST